MHETRIPSMRENLGMETLVLSKNPSRFFQMDSNKDESRKKEIPRSRIDEKPRTQKRRIRAESTKNTRRNYGRGQKGERFPERRKLIPFFFNVSEKY